MLTSIGNVKSYFLNLYLPCVGICLSGSMVAMGYDFKVAVYGFMDQASAGRIVFFDGSQNAWLSEGQNEPVSIGAFTVDSACNTKSQDTSFVSNGMTLAGRYLVSTTAICEFNIEQKKVSKVADLAFPNGVFGVSFLETNASKSYFVANSLDFPNAAAGELTLIEVQDAVDGNNPSVKTQIVAQNVPDASGAMLPFESSLYVTTAVFDGPNQLRSIPKKALIEAAQTAQPLDFAANSNPIGTGFLGLSLFLLSDGTQFYYGNSDISESLIFDPKVGLVRSVMGGCIPIGFGGSLWKSLCGTELKTTKTLEEAL
jgi:hypothetical protein